MPSGSAYVLLLYASLSVNLVIGRLIEGARETGKPGVSTLYLVVGLGGNLTFLGYFKYANFFVTTVNDAAGTTFVLQHVLLPLGISFYTFQKIAYLVDVARGEVRNRNFVHYSLFVLFFPQLIAGPIVHFRELAPQFLRRGLGRFAMSNIVVGVVLFGTGLFKKTVIADTAAQFATPVFDSAEAGAIIQVGDAWMAALSYAIQVYFDFSGYSDMAIGLARMFGIRLPLNFHSPYRASSIIDYWRRWHMTLQRFVVDYMFQPLSVSLARAAGGWGLGFWGNFLVAVALPTIVVFLFVGLWHGAGWTFVFFGLIQGATSP